ncbi:cadherin repeat domain-containing protein, partial [Winogradskyella sp.]|uniref:cadherin repeat domain-containing protein n=1 Tax=Winogradskyella sp. TaxID=1883156 RepID=UPI003511D6C4
MQVATKTNVKPQNTNIMNFSKKNHEDLKPKIIYTSRILIGFFIIIAFLTIIVSCTSKDNNNDSPSNSTIEVSVDENPSSGYLVTTIASHLSGDVSFSLTSESISQAFTLDSNSGELRVAAWQVYDYEVNPIITATVSASNGTDTENKIIIVNLNNTDDIWFFLNSSRDGYANASAGEWIAITEGEYNNLANNLFEVAKCGSTDSQYNRNDQISYDSNYYTYANDNGATIAGQSYLFAFKYTCNQDNLTNTKVTYSGRTGPQLAPTGHPCCASSTDADSAGGVATVPRGRGACQRPIWPHRTLVPGSLEVDDIATLTATEGD